MAKFKGARLPKKGKAGKPAADRPARRGAPAEDLDEVAAFHRSKDRLALDADADSDGGEDVLAESDEEGVLDLGAGASESELDSEDDEAQDKRLAAREFPFRLRLRLLSGSPVSCQAARNNPHSAQ